MTKIQQDPAIRNLLNRMPINVQNSFTDDQLAHLKIAIGARQWGNHAVDCRGVVKFFKYRYYFVFLAGRNKRNLNAKEQRFALLAQTVIVTLLSFCSLLILLLIAYLIKSALGINIFENFSFGIWSWFKELF